MIEEIISGGQTGVDRAALDAAILNNISYGGWCPKGRLDENGKIPSQYQKLQEISGDFISDKDNYAKRTIRNIKDSDATLILIPKKPMPENIKDGTLLTIEEVRKHQKPYLEINIEDGYEFNRFTISSWILEHRIKRLNVAGPRESSFQGIYQSSFKLLSNVLRSINNQEIGFVGKRCRL